MSVQLLRDTRRIGRLGELGEALAEDALRRNGFQNICNLNRERRHNYEFADLIAERKGERFFIGVKARNEMRSNGVGLNESYNFVLINDVANSAMKLAGKSRAEITELLLQHVHRLAAAHEATAAWITIPVRPREGTFSVYFGEVRTLGMKRCVPMTPKALASYECLVPWEYDSRIVEDLLN